MTEKKLDRIIIEIESQNENEYSFSENEKIILIIGDSPYSPKIAKNISPFGIYNTYNFNEVAFITNTKTLDMYSIVGILFGSIDDASMLINKLVQKKLMDKFAKYLFFKKNVMLVNVVGQQTNIDNLLGKYRNHIIFFCSNKKNIKLKNFKNINKKKTNNRYDCVFMANHPGSNSYRSGYKNSCETYFEHLYNDSKSNLKISDFKVF